RPDPPSEVKGQALTAFLASLWTCSPTQAGQTPVAFGRMLKTVSLAARKSPVALETPSGGVAMTVIWPPFTNACFPTMVKMTAFLDESYVARTATGSVTRIPLLLTRRVV